MSTESLRPSETLTISVALMVGILGGAVLLVLPGLVGALQDGYGFNERQLGYLSSADLGGLALGAALGTVLVPKEGLRRCAQWGLLVCAFANAAAGAVNALEPLLAIRVGAGLGGGMALAVCGIVLGRSKRVERYSSLYLLGQLTLGAIGLQLLPNLSAALGIGGVYLSLAGIFVVSLPLTRYLASSKDQSITGMTGVRAGSSAWIAVGAILVYFGVQGAIWAYLELIGQRAGLNSHQVASAVATSSLVGLAGPLTAGLIGSRCGRMIPLCVGLCLTLAALYLLNSRADLTRFAIAACLFNVAWNFSVPFQNASVAAVDGSGRMLGWTTFGSLAGLSLGPLASTWVIDAGGFGGVLWLGAILCILSYAGFIPIWIEAAGHAERTRSGVPACSTQLEERSLDC